MEKKQFEEKRKRYFWSQITDVLIGRQSRKVAFGVWGFIAGNAFLADGKITSDVWWKCFLTCALLIGFGTILDSIVEKMGDHLASKLVSKTSVEVTRVDTVQSSEVPVQ